MSIGPLTFVFIAHQFCLEKKETSCENRNNFLKWNINFLAGEGKIREG